MKHNVERSTCKNCEKPIIRFPDFGTGPGGWLHDPEKGFRLRRCRHPDEDQPVTSADPGDNPVTAEVIG